MQPGQINLANGLANIKLIDLTPEESIAKIENIVSQVPMVSGDFVVILSALATLRNEVEKNKATIESQKPTEPKTDFKAKAKPALVEVEDCVEERNAVD